MSRYIDADALIEAMGEEPYVWTDSAEEIAERNQWLTDMYIIESAPTIEPKRGKWITIDTKVVSVPIYWNEEQRQSDERGAGIQEKCKCSACGWITNFVGYRKLGVNKSFNFCPNCGADMRGIDDD